MNQCSSAPDVVQGPTPLRNLPKRSVFKSLVVGSSGMRSGWRVVLFYVVLAVLIASSILATRTIRGWLHIPRQATSVLTPARVLLNESIFLFGVLVTSAIFARFERRSFADYGLPTRGAFGVRFLEGLLWGVALMSCVLLVLRTTGNFSFGTIVLPTQKIIGFGLVWAGIFTVVGVTEGFAFSGYPLFALARGVGFWPAAGFLALLFGSVHFIVNAGENWLGSVSLVIVGFLLPFTIRRTGSLWFAIGIHAAWDWAQSFLYGVPDSGITVAGHLLDPSFYGSKWMTGGTAGPEASIVTIVGYVFAFALINLRFPGTCVRTGNGNK